MARRSRRDRLRLAHKGWGDRLQARHRDPKGDNPSTLSYGHLVLYYTYNRDMWRWIRRLGPKPHPSNAPQDRLA